MLTTMAISGGIVALLALLGIGFTYVPHFTLLAMVVVILLIVPKLRY